MVIQPFYYYLCLQLTSHLCHTTALSECIKAEQNMLSFSSQWIIFIFKFKLQINNLNQ